MVDWAIYHFWCADLLVCAVFYARAIIQFCAYPSQTLGRCHDLVPNHLSLSTRIDLSQFFLPPLPRLNAASCTDLRQYSLFQSDAQYFSQLGRGDFYSHRRRDLCTYLFTQQIFSDGDTGTCDLWRLDFYCRCGYFLF